MENHIIIKEDGTRLPWKKNRLNKNFCLLYHDNNQKYIFTPQTNLKCQLFMIGGGGAGGYYFGGGGGAGAAYINNNFTFEQGKTYTFSIGTGGTCDINDFDNLFKSGLSLNVYNNTTPKLNNISFNYDDYSSLDITSSGIIQSFIVNNITINPSIFNTNTTYIWNGYIKSTINDNDDKSKIITIRLNSKIRTIMWVNTYHYTNENAFISTPGETNIQEVKVLELDPNKFYNIKIIAYNFDTANNANFNVEFVNCKLYNYNKNFETYNVVPATDTSLTFKTISTNENNVISCKGGGTGGFGLYNQNKDLNGGCGGGSGINKIKGISINNNPIYNGNDGAIGDYCGGGGGIISKGNNNNGGEGKNFNWFDETLIFGAGGNGANINETRNLGYGCGGNGGDCCYFSKSLINNNGNNGCILIYVSDTNDIIEGFNATVVYKSLDINKQPQSPVNESSKTVNYLDLYHTHIASKLISESYQITNKNDNSIIIPASGSGDTNTRKDYFESVGLSFTKLSVNDAAATNTATVPDNNNMHNFIYDVLVISKIYAVSYRLLYHYYNVDCGGNISTFANFMKDVNIKFTNSDDTAVYSEIKKDDEGNNIIQLNNIFNIKNLNLAADTSNNTYKNLYVGDTPDSPNIKSEVFDYSIDDIKGSNTGYHMPAYHKLLDGAFIKGFNLFIKETASPDIYVMANLYNKELNKIQATNLTTTITIDRTNSGTADCNITFCNGSGFLNKAHLTSIGDTLSAFFASNNQDNYEYSRVLLYLEAFNNILNANTYVSLLPMLKFQMYTYNAIIYNVILQYQIFTYQKNRLALKVGTLTGSGGSPIVITDVGVQTPATVTITNTSTNIRGYYSGSDAGIVLIGNGTALNNVGLVESSFAMPNLGAASFVATSYNALTTTKTDKYEGIHLTPILDNVLLDITTLGSNLESIINNNINTPNNVRDTINEIVDIINIQDNSNELFTKNQKELNETINKYNIEYDNNNNLLYYYKIIIIIAIFLVLLIFFIFTLNSIDNNTKIGIYIFLILFIIILLLYYNNTFVITENFVIVYNKNQNTNIIYNPSGGANINYSSYKGKLQDYNTKIIKIITNATINKDMLFPIKVFSNKADTVRTNKAEYYKLKKINLDNGIDILKKTSNTYYYMILLMIMSTLILLVSLILLLINPAMLLQIIALAIIFALILIYYISYKINRSTRMAENKNYWANFNPSKDTLDDL